MVLADVRASAAVLLLLAGGCASVDYAPCPVEPAAGLPADAFERCRRVLLREFAALVVDDAEAFRLQTAWSSAAEAPIERRATLYRDDDRGGLWLVVEMRRLTAPWFGLPRWTKPRGDAAAERRLEALLAAALDA
jgi:hypothetical protein